MIQLIAEYKSVEYDIKRFKRLLVLLGEEMVKKSPLKIGTLVERNRGIDSENGVHYKISSIIFNDDEYCLTYGIKLVGDMGDYDTYSCINEEKLKKIEGK